MDDIEEIERLRDVYQSIIDKNMKIIRIAQQTVGSFTSAVSQCNYEIDRLRGEDEEQRV